MAKIGAEYVFCYRVKAADDAQDANIAEKYHNSHVRVLRDLGKNEHGNLYEVETTDGRWFNAYQKELDNLDANDKKHWSDRRKL